MQTHTIHPFTDPKSFDARDARMITKGKGVYVWDKDGNKILDGMAGLWCVNVGYDCKDLIKAADKQMKTLPYYNSFFMTSNPAQQELSDLLTEVTPDHINHFFYGSSGSESNDTIIRLAWHYWSLKNKPSKKIFISRDKAYHGSTLGASSLGGMKYMHAMGESLLGGFSHIDAPHWYLEGVDLSEEAFGLAAAQQLEDKILELGAGNIAAFIGEPILGAGGVIKAPDNYWPEIQRICKKHDILLIADEVICGFGRLGEWFGCDALGIKPDFMTMAKGITSGYVPLSAVGISDDIWSVLNEGGKIHHGYTYSGHPLACAVAIANLKYIRDHKLIETVRDDIGPYFQGKLKALAEAHPLVGEVRGHGLLAALQLMKDKTKKIQFSEQDDAGLKCWDYCFENDLIVRAIGHSIALCPPLTITRKEIDLLCDKLKRSLDMTWADLKH